MPWHGDRLDSSTPAPPPERPVPAPPVSDPWLMWKIAGGILIALFVWRAFEAYQERVAMEMFLREMQAITKPGADPLGLQAAAARQRQAEAARQAAQSRVVAASRAAASASTTPGIRALPAGYRCVQGTLLYQAEDGALKNITAQTNHWHCPGGGVQNCWQVTPAAVGCR